MNTQVVLHNEKYRMRVHPWWGRERLLGALKEAGFAASVRRTWFDRGWYEPGRSPPEFKALR
jgi:hypothetical protein